jgi:hypothetical protein
MPRAVLKNGVIYPVDPLPPEWADGKELRIESMEEAVVEPDADEKWFQQLEAAAQQIDPRDIEKLEVALKKADEQAKAMARREMGLP